MRFGSVRAFGLVAGLWAAAFGCSGRQSSSGGAGGTATSEHGGSPAAGGSTANVAGNMPGEAGEGGRGTETGRAGRDAGAAGGNPAGGTPSGGASGSGSGTGTGGTFTAGASGAGQVGGGGTGGSGNGLSNCPWGDQAVHSTEYGDATTLRLCLVSAEERNLRFQVTTPNAPAGGGYVVVSIRNVATSLYVRVGITPAKGSLLSSSMTAGRAGEDFDTWFAAQPSADFFIDVSDTFSLPLELGHFTASATYVPVPDAYETNNDLEQAKPIPVGQPIEAYAFEGYGRPASVISSDWFDWYKVTLPAGTPSVTLEGVSTDMSLTVALVDPQLLGGYVATGSTGGPGRVTIKPASALPPGDYDIVVMPAFSSVTAFGKGKSPARYATKPYVLTVMP